MFFIMFLVCIIHQNMKTVHEIRKSTDLFCPGDRRELTREGSNKQKNAAKLLVTSEEKLPIKSGQILVIFSLASNCTVPRTLKPMNGSPSPLY